MQNGEQEQGKGRQLPIEAQFVERQPKFKRVMDNPALAAAVVLAFGDTSNRPTTPDGVKYISRDIFSSTMAERGIQVPLSQLELEMLAIILDPSAPDGVKVFAAQTLRLH